MFHLYPQFTMPTITDVVNKNQQFLCEFVNLKQNGFHHYTKALNELTGGFWKPVLDQANQQIDKLADDMKLTIKFK